VKKAGDLLAAFFDEETLKKAKVYGGVFSSWSSLLDDCGLPQGVSHSRIGGLEKGVLQVEADHPGWIQLLQTRQREILNAARRRFPELTLSGISFRLSREPPAAAPDRSTVRPAEPQRAELQTDPRPRDETSPPAHSTGSQLDSIKDEKLRNALKKLEHSIYERDAQNREKKGT
jgi:hypothetical protein